MIFYGFFIILGLLLFAIYAGVLTKNMLEEYRGEQEEYEQFKISESKATSWLEFNNSY